MTHRPPAQFTLDSFERLLDVYGSDRDRWPLADRAAAAQLLATSDEARRTLAVSQAFERVLSAGALPHLHGAATATLAERIAAHATARPRLVAVAEDKPVASVRQTSAVSVLGDAGWQRRAALLAASLMVGIFVGQTPLGASAVPRLAALAGLAMPAGDQVALADFDVDAPEVD